MVYGQRAKYSFLKDSFTSETLTENIAVYAKWTVETYDITFVGVKGENTNKTTFTIEDEDIILSDLSCDGYTFDGWYNGSTKVTKIAKGTFGNITLTAKWTLTEYVVTFKLDGKEIGTTTYTIENKNITLPTVDDKKGYTVVWDKYTLTTGDVTINAYYQAINVTVTFNYDGADGNNTVQSVVIGYEEKISFPVPTKSGQTFKGWQVNGQTFNNDDVWTIDEDCTVIALWEKVKPFTRVDENDDKSDTGSFIYFGSYPQSDVTESMSTILADKVAALPTSSNLNGWTSYGYYIESSNETDFMWYKDVEYSGSKYRAVYFTSYRPEKTSYDSSKYATYQDDNGYNISNVYWFKYEPIKWRILEESNGKATLLAEMILDSQDYNYTSSSRTIDGKTVYSNNYEYSNIRKWLNDNFYNTAFSELEKALIQTVEVDNSARSTNPDNNATEWNSGVNSYACNNTNDKVWLLSQQEVTRASYGFATSPYTYDTVRQKKMTAYSQCQGVYTSTEPDYVGNGYWWLRSPNCNYNSSMRGSCCYGKSSSSQDVREILYGGVVPALQISL